MLLGHLQAVDSWGTVDVLINNAGTKSLILYGGMSSFWVHYLLSFCNGFRYYKGWFIDENEDIAVAGGYWSKSYRGVLVHAGKLLKLY